MSLHLIEGGGEIVDFLERLMTMARDGKIDAIAVAVAETGGVTGTSLAFRASDALFPRTLGAVATLNYDLVSGRLGFD